MIKSKKSTRDTKLKSIKKQITGKKIPILTLDPKWHELFVSTGKPPSIKALEDKLNALLKEQGKMVTDLKGLKEVKTKLMQEIIENMDANDTNAGRQKAKILEQNKKLIAETTDRIGKTEDEIVDIPYKIKEINEQLIVESAVFCSERIKENRKIIDETTGWIVKVREELKKRILQKNELEENNAKVYSYIHDLLGAEVLEQLDDNFKHL